LIKSADAKLMKTFENESALLVAVCANAIMHQHQNQHQMVEEEQC